jgi:diguanylate cyclase (GGDEF)-like protein
VNFDDRNSGMSDEGQRDPEWNPFPHDERELFPRDWLDEPAGPTEAGEPAHSAESAEPTEPTTADADADALLVALAEEAVFDDWLEEPLMPAGWSDATTSTDGPRYWDRLISSERARINRYRRPATVVLIDIDGINRLEPREGIDVAAQLLVRVGRALTAEIRSGDHAARIDVGRFGVYLPETDEVAAINFVERVRVALETEFQWTPYVRIAIGWESPTDGDLDVALALANQRLLPELAPGR